MNRITLSTFGFITDLGKECEPSNKNSVCVARVILSTLMIHFLSLIFSLSRREFFFIFGKIGRSLIQFTYRFGQHFEKYPEFGVKTPLRCKFRSSDVFFPIVNYRRGKSGKIIPGNLFPFSSVAVLLNNIPSLAHIFTVIGLSSVPKPVSKISAGSSPTEKGFPSLQVFFIYTPFSSFSYVIARGDTNVGGLSEIINKRLGLAYPEDRQHDHLPHNDAYTIAFDHQALIRVRNTVGSFK